MAKRQRKKTTPARETRSEAEIAWVRMRLEEEKQRMFSLLNFKEDIHEKIEELFDINFEGMLEGMEPMCFTKAVFKIRDIDQVRKKLKRLHNIDLAEDNPPLIMCGVDAIPKDIGILPVNFQEQDRFLRILI